MIEKRAGILAPVILRRLCERFPLLEMPISLKLAHSGAFRQFPDFPSVIMAHDYSPLRFRNVFCAGFEIVNFNVARTHSIGKSEFDSHSMIFEGFADRRESAFGCSAPIRVPG
jgi:hypothetical protein